VDYSFVTIGILNAQYEIVTATDASQLMTSFPGWTRSHTVFVHSSTLRRLCMNARQPALLTDTSQQQPVIVWPLDSIGQLRIGIINRRQISTIGTNTGLIMLRSFDHQSINTIDTVYIRTIDADKSFYGCREFIEFLQIYLSDAYLDACTSFTVTYFGQQCRLAVDNLSTSFDQLKLVESSSTIRLLHLSSNVRIFVSKRDEEVDLK
jgi:hypothetical protein